MNFTLYINGKKRRFTFDAGWYSGNDVVLLGLILFGIDDRDTTIIALQILKFSLNVSIEALQ